MLYLITLLFLILIEIYLMLFYNRKVTNKQTLELPNTSGRMYYNRLPNSNDTNLLVYLSGGPTLGYRDYVDQTIFNLSKNGVDMPWFVYKNSTEFPIFAINEIEQYSSNIPIPYVISKMVSIQKKIGNETLRSNRYLSKFIMIMNYLILFFTFTDFNQGNK